MSSLFNNVPFTADDSSSRELLEVTGPTVPSEWVSLQRKRCRRTTVSLPPEKRGVRHDVEWVGPPSKSLGPWGGGGRTGLQTRSRTSLLRCRVGETEGGERVRRRAFDLCDRGHLDRPTCSFLCRGYAFKTRRQVDPFCGEYS